MSPNFSLNRTALSTASRLAWPFGYLHNQTYRVELMKQFIKILFFVSDTLAWLLLALTVVSTLVFVFIGPNDAQENNYTVSHLEIWATCIVSVCVIVGAYAITRHRPFGIVLVSLPAILLFFAGGLLSGLVSLGLVLVIFGTPFLLVFIEAHRHI
jgi:hypothetical protein